MNRYSVLLVDDNRELVERVKGRISRQQTIDGVTWDIALEAVLIEVEDHSGGQRLTKATVRALLSACSRPPDLILADYAYSSAAQLAKLYNGEMTTDEFLSKMLSAPDLVPAVEELAKAERPGDGRHVALVRKAMRENSCPLYLYTYTPKKFRNSLPTVDARCKLTKHGFERAQLYPIDISEQLYENGLYDVDEPSARDKQFRAYLTTGLLEQIVHRELLQFVLRHERNRLRFVRFYRSGFGVLAIVLLGGGIGAVGEWLGARMMALYVEGSGGLALAIGLLAALVFFVLGVCVPLLFERIMTNLLRQAKHDTDNDG